MAQISEITVEDLKSNTRIDAEFYQPFYLKIDELLTAQPYLIDLCKKITDFGAYSQMNFVNFVEEGVRFYRNQDVGEVFKKTNSPVYIDEDAYQKLSLKLEEGDILTPRVGTLGNAAIISKSDLPASANQNLAQVKPDTKKVDSFYLAVFLCTQFGKSQFLRFATGNVQPWLNLQQIGSIKVFLPNDEDQKRISDKSKQSLEKLYRSNDLYREAEKILLQELGLEDYTSEWVAGYETDFNNILEVARMDAEYFQPRYELLMNRICNSKKTEKLGKISALSKKKVDIQTEETYKYIEIGDVNTSNGELSYNEIAGSDLPANAKKSIQDESLLISTVRPTRGAVGVIPKGWNDGFVVSGAFAVFEKHSISPFYLQVVMRSVVGKMQLERRCTGVSYPTVTDEDVVNVVIPLLNDEKIKKVHDLVMESHKSLRESRQLLEQAKRKVEEMIESKTN